MLASTFQPFLEQAPLCVMTRLTLESLFFPIAWMPFSAKLPRSSTKGTCLFSQVVELMQSVVLRVHPTVHAAYKSARRNCP